MTKSDVLANPRLYIPYWFGQKRLGVKANLILSEQDQSFELDLVFNVMWLDLKQELREENAGREVNDRIRGFSEGDLTKALEEFLEAKRQEAMNEVRNSLKCDGENLDELRRFLIAATGDCDEIQLAVLAHMLWQIKRKMFHKRVKDHVMVVFRGAQGAGKTEAVKILFSVIKAWFKGASLKEVTDDRWKFFFKNALVVFCDELQHAEWASIDALKNIISADEFESRKLGTNIYSSVRQNCTFVGASNRPLAEIIRDNTGMRRFFEIETLTKMDWDEINSVDVQKIWQGIDENRNEPYIRPFKQKISALQADLILPDPEEDFLSHFNLTSGPKESPGRFIANSDLYSAYVLFMKRNGERTKPSNAFHRKIKGMGMKLLEVRQGHKGERGYQISEESIQHITQYRNDHLFEN